MLRRTLNDEKKEGESSSISSQRMIIEKYCQANEISLVREFVDDGYSGGNFDRPGFKSMISQLEKGQVKLVITKDLSRLGRDMIGVSQYTEKFFPEHGIRYIAISDSFDTTQTDVMAPLRLAINEVYLIDGSVKVRNALKTRRENGQYCACPPYGYKKDPQDKQHLVRDEVTAPVVERIFRQAAEGDSARKIALDLNQDGIIPPLKYRALYRDEFSPEGAARASDLWNYTTVKRILKNEVYLGHTQLGKSQKASVKSKKKIPVEKEYWAITEHTHEPLVGPERFERVRANMGKNTSDFRKHEKVRNSIFKGITKCALCGYSLCSGGTVYKGKREEYWYLNCTRQRKGVTDPCTGTRIRYEDLMEVVRQDLNELLAMSREEMEAMAETIIAEKYSMPALQTQKLQREKAEARLNTIDKIIEKLYLDNAEGLIDDARMSKMLTDLEAESRNLKSLVLSLSTENPAEKERENFERLFELCERYTHIDHLDRDVLLTFIERIEVSPKEYPEGTQKNTHRNQPFTQKVRIFYKFVGELGDDSTRSFPV
jgi:DNA invertase Pin-like site-specific DNA recombinase